AITTPLRATTITFEPPPAGTPSVLTTAAAVTYGNATFNNGELLFQETFLPADQTTVYGTGWFCTGCGDIVIDFAVPVTNFNVLMLNAQLFTVTYTITDNNGNADSIILAQSQGPDSSGILRIFAGGITQITFSSASAQYLGFCGFSCFDYSIDNINYNYPVPEPATGGLLATAACVAWRR